MEDDCMCEVDVVSERGTDVDMIEVVGWVDEDLMGVHVGECSDPGGGQVSVIDVG